MNEKPEMLDFVKAMMDADRLRIIGVLTKRSASVTEVAAQLGLPVRDALNHLAFLEFVGAVSKSEETYQLNPSGLEALSKQQLGGGRESYVPAPDVDAKSRKVLVTYLNADGSIKQIPQQVSKLRVLLEYLVAAFTPGVDYTEKEVNAILRRFNVDVAGLRRDLIDAGLMARESNGSRYWRTSPPTPLPQGAGGEKE
jgi:hypothetical protein